MWAIIAIVLALVAFAVIASLTVRTVKEGSSKAVENTCRLSLAQANSYAVLGKQIVFSPRCKAQIFDLPRKGSKKKEAILKEMSDLIADCWWSHLEGTLHKNTLGKTVSWSNFCNVCYIFTISDLEGSDEFFADELETYMEKNVHTVNSESESCNLGGGFCVHKDATLKTKEECLAKDGFKYVEDFGTCQKKYGGSPGCCYSSSNCLNSGGSCETICSDDKASYNGWQCSGGKTCCVDKENYYNYVDYVQRAKGPGKIMMGVDKFYEDKEVYAISFLAKTENFFSVFDYSELSNTQTGINGIMITPYDKVKSNCSVEN